MPASLANAVPILRVKNLAESIAYYTGPLGFKLDWQTPAFASVSRDRCSFMVSEGEQGYFGTWLWVPVSDVEELHAEWLTTGAFIRQGPTNFPWGSLEIQVTDPNGHILRFASDGKPGMLFGPWMDVDGKLWSMDS